LATTRISRDAYLHRPESFELGRAWFPSTSFGHGVTFSGAIFGDGATFTGATFGRVTKFTNAFFGFQADFSMTTFGEGADFTGKTTFGDAADFTGATFGLGPNFDDASLSHFAFFCQAFFGPGACFRNAVFGNAADFSTATFEGPSIFTAATFGDGASFGAAAIGDTAHFEQTHFKGSVSFAGASTKQWAKRFVRRQGTTEEAHAKRERRHKESWERDGSGPDRFLRISFADACFDDKTNFSGRSFESKANCIGTQFHSPPDFDRTTNVSRIDFTGAHIGFSPPGTLVHWTEDSDIPLQLRAFRKIVEETKNHDLERDLYIEERKAERGVYWHQLFEELKKSPWREKRLISGRLLVHALWIIVMFFYWRFPITVETSWCPPYGSV
jgi:hypothetical protein